METALITFILYMCALIIALILFLILLLITIPFKLIQCIIKRNFNLSYYIEDILDLVFETLFGS